MAPMFVTNRAPLIRRQVRKTLKINVFIVCIRNTIPLFSKINLTVTWFIRIMVASDSTYSTCVSFERAAGPVIVNYSEMTKD